MGAGANSSRNASLNDRRERSAGRQDDRGPGREAIADAGGVSPGKGKGRAGGAFGRAGQANRRSGNVVGEGGGGGGAATSSRESTEVRASTRPAKRR
jgi:hypothetical protein